ncbi:PPK2 family polyphosphate kinase [Mycetocola zhujimingii]|uniref:PPK2 family polyphosphate kinase n=1 Tax=Mycetocola zhujimingii TaxID=2079792 RepID=UPI000D37B37D|nr:PPK2 family polyphosphate kinase [Mycetocola zhujimingii]AWB85479.1 phosphate--nucleotide phosphotransferase [Mycetocola zhujimingii]
MAKKKKSAETKSAEKKSEKKSAKKSAEKLAEKLAAKKSAAKVAAKAAEKSAEKSAAKPGKNSQASAWRSSPASLLRVSDGFVLADVAPESTPGFSGGKREGRQELATDAVELSAIQERLFASSKGGAPDAVLLVLQAMDTAGKGGIVRHVVGSVDPQGVTLTAFKAPTRAERRHDFLWRIERRVPEPGFIGVFDRSHYEDVLIGSVRKLASDEEIERRFDAILDFESRLADRNVRVVKVMLQISPDEQKRRLAERLDRPDKHWKFNPADIDEREIWPDYQAAYQRVFDRTSTEGAPWFVVPANHKWYARAAVQRLLLDALTDIDPQWPVADFDVAEQKARLAASTLGQASALPTQHSTSKVTPL